MASEIRGVVCSGKSEASRFTQLDWVRQQFRDKLGFDPFPGTLNLKVSGSDAAEAMRSHSGVAIEPSQNYCAARCYPVRINNQVDAVWIMPDLPEYAPELVELMAPFSLREALALEDGTIVTLKLIGDM